MSIARCHALRLEVGSYALMHKTGFELMDMLLCCKFAEGDSRILQMKLMRDRLKKVKKDGVAGTLSQVFGKDGTEAIKALQLANKLNVGRDLEKMEKAMNDNWEEGEDGRRVKDSTIQTLFDPISNYDSLAAVYELARIVEQVRMSNPSIPKLCLLSMPHSLRSPLIAAPHHQHPPQLIHGTHHGEIHARRSILRPVLEGQGCHRRSDKRHNSVGRC